MKKTEFYLLMDEIMEYSPGTITGSEVLANLEGWDSVKVVEMLALLDERFGINLDVDKLLKCETIADLTDHLGDCIEA
jgi:acyl carrier protein